MNLRMDSEGSSRTVLLECERQQGRQAVSLSGCQEEGDGKAEEKATPFAMEVASSWMEGGGFRESWKAQGAGESRLGPKPVSPRKSAREGRGLLFPVRTRTQSSQKLLSGKGKGTISLGDNYFPHLLS